MRYDKRGISPLIATVLLVGFVIVLAVLAWVFFSDTLTQFQEKAGAECTAVDSVNSEIGVSSCVRDGNSVTLSVANKGQGTIDGFRTRLFSGDEAISITAKDTFDAGDSRSYTTSSTDLAGTVDKAQVIPFIIKDKKLVVCDQNLVEIKC
jgi:flagellin-like protein